VVDDVSAETLQPHNSKNVSTGSTICSDTRKAYSGSLQEGMFIVSSIIENTNALTEKAPYKWSERILGLLETETRF
jgi:hypothetical protein